MTRKAHAYLLLLPVDLSNQAELGEALVSSTSVDIKEKGALEIRNNANEDLHSPL